MYLFLARVRKKSVDLQTIFPSEVIRVEQGRSVEMIVKELNQFSISKDLHLKPNAV